MTTAHTTNTHWIDAWLETQQGWVGRWLSLSTEQRVDATRVAMETLHQQFSPDAAGCSPELLGVVGSFQSLLQASLSASGEWAKLHAAGEATLGGLPFATWPLGPMREHQQRWQHYVHTHAAMQLAQSVWLGRIAALFTQSLQAVPEQVAARAAAGKPINGFRELYELWIDCGEQVFANEARDPAFVAAQANVANAMAEWRLAQQALLEQWLKQHDLPTRSELNSVHRQLREQQQRIVELQQLLAAQRTTDRP